MLVHQPRGNYRFLQGIAPYSGGVIADPGFEIHHVRFGQPPPMAEGFAAIQAQLSGLNRPLASLCGIELRSPAPFTFQGFRDFNAGYIGVLKDWDLFVGEANPVARTNVAPAGVSVSEPCMYGFSYIVPSRTINPTFVVAGAGELPEGSLDPADVVRSGDLSADGLREKIRFVMSLMTGRLHGLGVTWDSVTVTDVYTVHPICEHLVNELVEPAGNAAVHGLTWHYSRPPIVSIEFEMDLRSTAVEHVIMRA